MKEAKCIESCFKGMTFYREGRTYEVDETDPFMCKHFGLEPPVKEKPKTDGKPEGGGKPK